MEQIRQMVRRTACFEPFEAVVVCSRAALAVPSRSCQARPWFCLGLVKDFLPRLSVGKVLVTRVLVERFSDVQPTMGACGTSGGSCCPYDGLSSQRRPASPPKARWPHIELDSVVSPTDEIDWFSVLHDWRTCVAESHNSRLFQQCVKLQVVGIACS